MPDEVLRIPTRFRVGLLVKGLALVGLAGVFLGLLARVWSEALHLPALLLCLVLFGVPAGFLVGVSRLAFLDAGRGEALRVSGAEALASRMAGHSLRLPTGRFAEFLLYNPWAPLTPGHRYTVVIGRRSLVLVEPPQPD